jgi:hypothetical protein
MYFGNVEIDIGNKTTIISIIFFVLIFVIFITILYLHLVTEEIHKGYVICISLLILESLGAICLGTALDFFIDVEDNKRLENSSKNIYTAITDYYTEAKEINIKNNSYGEFISEGKTYRFFIEDNNLHIKDIDEDLETIIDGKYY